MNHAIYKKPEHRAEVRAFLADKARLDWLCKFITNKGLNGLRNIPWTVYDEDGDSLMNRKTISEDEVGDIQFDRAAIDKAMAAERKAI